MHLKFRNVNDAFQGLVQMFHSRELYHGSDWRLHGNPAPIREAESRNGPVLVIEEPVIITYAKPRERVLFHRGRDCNPFFHLYEALWMLAGREDVKPLVYYTSQIGQFSDDGRTFNGAYGRRWRGAGGVPQQLGPGRMYRPGIDQLDRLVKHLRAFPESRRAVLSMWNVEQDLLKIGTGLCPTCEGEWTKEKAERLDESGDKCPNCAGDPAKVYIKEDISKDVCCNLSVMFSLRESPEQKGSMLHPVTRLLDMTVTNRSNDLVWGALGANVVHFSILQEYIAGKLGVGVGVYNQISNNLHVYRERFDPVSAVWMEDWAEDREAPDPYTEGVAVADANDWGADFSVPCLDCQPKVFDQELIDFVEVHNGGEATLNRPVSQWGSPWLNNVAHPMMMAFHNYKQKEYPTAFDWVEQIHANDWRLAARNWLQKRAEKAQKGV